jgi:nanoRNase/pAp phosphatase (c-di-AMP/oligoRNAs hydrolase)
METERLESLYSAVRDAQQVLILPHNDPDPDAMASALALSHLLTTKLGAEAPVVYRGLIGRAENQALVRYLGHPLRYVTAKDLLDQTPIALVDTQPGMGNHALPADRGPAIVIDHHPWREETASATFADVRPDVGSTSTILAGYLEAAAIEPTPALATALFYGIKSDTLGLVRGASSADVEAYFRLQSRIDVPAIVEIESAQVPVEYFRRLDAALHKARVYDEVVISYVGPMQRPDLAAEMADLLLRLQGMCWAICMGLYDKELVLAVRSRIRQGGAGKLVQAIVPSHGLAGGHGVMAAGQVALQGADPEQLADELAQRALAYLNIKTGGEGTPLLG